MRLDFKVSADAAGQRLDKFLRKRMEDMPLSHLYKLVRTKKVRVNGARAEIARGDERGAALLRLAGGKPEVITARHVAQAARQGDPLAMRPGCPGRSRPS